MATTRKSTTAKKKTATAKRATKTVAARANSSTKKAVAKTTKKVTATPKKAAAKAGSARTAVQKLRIWNFVLAFVYAAQAVAIVLLSQDKFAAVTTNYLTTDPISGDGSVLVSATRHLFDVNIAYALAVVLALSAITHLALATIRRRRYEAALEKRINLTRWYDYALTVGLLTAVVASLVGITNAATLLLIFGVTAVASLIGRIQEADAPASRIGYLLGAKAGLLAWVAIGLSIWGLHQYGEGSLPSYVYYLVESALVLLVAFGLNVWLTLRAQGRWASYNFGETAYSLIALVLKSAIAWQVFFGLLK